MTHTFHAPPLQIPDGRYADHEEMAEFGHTLKKFIQEQEQALEEVTSLTRHNQIVDFLNVLADAYNEQLAVYKEEEERRQQEMVVILTQIVTMEQPPL